MTFSRLTPHLHWGREAAFRFVWALQISHAWSYTRAASLIIVMMVKKMLRQRRGKREAVAEEEEVPKLKWRVARQRQLRTAKFCKFIEELPFFNVDMANPIVRATLWCTTTTCDQKRRALVMAFFNRLSDFKGWRRRRRSSEQVWAGVSGQRHSSRNSSNYAYCPRWLVLTGQGGGAAEETSKVLSSLCWLKKLILVINLVLK